MSLFIFIVAFIGTVVGYVLLDVYTDVNPWYAAIVLALGSIQALIERSKRE